MKRINTLFGNPTRAANTAKVPLVLIVIALVIGFSACDGDDGGSTTDTREPVINSKGSTPASITVPATTSVQLNCDVESADGSDATVLWSVHEKPQGANPQIANTGAA
jgi:hypothetical protein